MGILWKTTHLISVCPLQSFPCLYISAPGDHAHGRDREGFDPAHVEPHEEGMPSGQHDPIAIRGICLWLSFRNIRAFCNSKGIRCRGRAGKRTDPESGRGSGCNTVFGLVEPEPKLHSIPIIIRLGYLGLETRLSLVQTSEVYILTGLSPTRASSAVSLNNGIPFSGTNEHMRQVPEMSLGMDKESWVFRDGCSPGHVNFEGYRFAYQVCSN